MYKTFENFDKGRLRELAIKFVNEKYVNEMNSSSRSIGGSLSFAMAGLRALVGKTLQVEPATRPINLIAFPIMTIWK